MRTARFDGSKDLYFVLTCGAGTYGAQTYAKRLCEETGMNFRGFKTVVMPENYIAMFNVPDQEKSARIVAAAMRPVKAAVKSIAAGEDMPEKNPPLGMFMSTIVNWFFYKFTISDKGFHLEKPCVSCGKCVELCPLNNVSLVDGKPVWGGNCTHCMACICGCPAECIEYNKASQKRRRYWFGK
jgi:ferredoxin